MSKALNKAENTGASTGASETLIDARDALLKRIGYRFRDSRLLEEAMTHSSVRASDPDRDDYQRLEFLGDRVIGLVIADTLFESLRGEREGALSRRYHDSVANSRLAEIARGLDIGASLEMADKAVSDKVLADALEALMGAIWRDGGIESARAVIARVWGDLLAEGASSSKDNKSRLQEYAMKKGVGLPAYRLVEQRGAAHAPQFVIEVSLEGRTAEAMGSSKQQAEQQAAGHLLEQIEGQAS